MLLRQLYFLPGILKREWMIKKELEKTVSKMLQSLLREVYDTNLFYREKYKGLSVSRIRTLDSLTTLPFTTKDEMRKAFPDSLSSGYTLSNCVHESTSGSTGNLLDIYHDRAAYDYYESTAFRAYRGYGYNLRYKIAYTRFEPTKKEFIEYLGMFRKYYIPVHYSTDQQLDLLVQYNPEVISAYPSSLYEIARKIEGEPVCIQPKFIISHSELLTDRTKEYLSYVFDCPVYRDYSSFEVHFIATECTNGGMHIHLDNSVVEVVKDGEPVAPGETGEIVVTNLKNRAMPFIRYRTGDLGAFDEGECTCGRGLPLLKMVEGRKDEHLILPSGKKVSPRISDLLNFMFHPYISKYQIVQKKKDKIVIFIVEKENYNKKIEEKLKKEVRVYIPDPVEIDVVKVDDIKKTGRGKYRAVISEVNT